MEKSCRKEHAERLHHEKNETSLRGLTQKQHFFDLRAKGHKFDALQSRQSGTRCLKRYFKLIAIRKKRDQVAKLEQ